MGFPEAMENIEKIRIDVGRDNRKNALRVVFTKSKA